MTWLSGHTFASEHSPTHHNPEAQLGHNDNTRRRSHGYHNSQQFTKTKQETWVINRHNTTNLNKTEVHLWFCYLHHTYNIHWFEPTLTRTHLTTETQEVLWDYTSMQWHMEVNLMCSTLELGILNVINAPITVICRKRQVLSYSLRNALNLQDWTLSSIKFRNIRTYTVSWLTLLNTTSRYL
jgi:hypothetical protein